MIDTSFLLVFATGALLFLNGLIAHVGDLRANRDSMEAQEARDVDQRTV